MFAAKQVCIVVRMSRIIRSKVILRSRGGSRPMKRKKNAKNDNIIYLAFLVLQQHRISLALCLITSSNQYIHNPLLISRQCNQCFHAAIGRKCHHPRRFGCIPGPQYTAQTDRYTTGLPQTSCYDLCTFSCH